MTIVNYKNLFLVELFLLRKHQGKLLVLRVHVHVRRVHIRENQQRAVVHAENARVNILRNIALSKQCVIDARVIDDDLIFI